MGFTKNRLYSSYAWKNGWRVQWDKAKKNHKVLRRTDEGWVGHYQFGTRIRKRFNDNKDYDGKIIDYNPFTEWYSISYDDGDKEEFTPEEVEKYITKTTTDDNGTHGPTGDGSDTGNGYPVHEPKRICSRTNFYMYWRNHHSNVVVRKPSKDICGVCFKYNTFY